MPTIIQIVIFDEKINFGDVVTPNALITFALVARFGSITRAAEFLNLGQPAVSGQLKQLQEAVGEPLYERRGHQIVLTPTGQGLLEYAERIERVWRETREFVQCLQRVNLGVLRIGATMTIASYYLPRHLAEMQRLHPEVSIYMQTGNTQEIVQNLADMDLGFVEGPVSKDQLPAKFRLIPWQTDEIVLIVHRDHEIARRYPQAVPLKVFSEYQVVWRERGSGARQAVEERLAEGGVEAPVKIEVIGVAGIKEAVRAGLGIGFASSRALRYETTDLVSRRIDPPAGLTWHLNVIAPKEPLLAQAARAFLGLCTREGADAA